ncbi:MAG: DNA translocase FtsK [Hyphomicrobiales bacterium]
MRSSRPLAASFFDPDDLRRLLSRNSALIVGLGLIALSAATAASLATWTITDPSLNHAVDGPVRNLLGRPGAIVSDLLMQMIGLAAAVFLMPVAIWGWRLAFSGVAAIGKGRIFAWLAGTFLAAGAAACLPLLTRWPLPTGLGGALGDLIRDIPAPFVSGLGSIGTAVIGLGFGLAAATLLLYAGRPAATAGTDAGEEVAEVDDEDFDEDDDDRASLTLGALSHLALSMRGQLRRLLGREDSMPRQVRREAERPQPGLMGRILGGDDYAAIDDDGRIEPMIDGAAPRRAARAEPAFEPAGYEAESYSREPAMRAPAPAAAAPQVTANGRVTPAAPAPKPGRRITREAQPSLLVDDTYQLPPLVLLAEPKAPSAGSMMSADALEQNARLLEGVLEDFGVKGDIIHVRPGPVVTLYELEPAPGIKSSRVIGLADDIARSMSAISARVAVIPGKNAIGIELPNARRDTVYLRELVAAEDFEKSKARLPLCLGKTIGGEPVIADLARMPHLLIAGTTGSGKSVAINTMILSLLYRMTPDRCKLIMIDPKMLELSVYDGIPHLLSPVVTDPKKAVVALKWTVREMEERYRRMSKLGVRNIDGYNARVEQAKKRGEVIHRTVQTGFDRDTGEAIYEQEELDLAEMPYIVVIVDEMADLMMVAGKEIEGAIQRLAQMARAAGIHIVMATQRPSVDVITGTIKANFPTRISFQVTSKIDSRTILGEQGAEQLLGQGDMLYMAGGGRIQRVHGPFVSDGEVEEIVAHLKEQGTPEYLEAITEEDDAEPPFDMGGGGSAGGDGEGDLYDQAVAVVLRDKKASTSYVQRRLAIGYNRAASLIERMEKEGIISAANHAGKREILVGGEGGDDL